jgi:hypothetical protein
VCVGVEVVVVDCRVLRVADTVSRVSREVRGYGEEEKSLGVEDFMGRPQAPKIGPVAGGDKLEAQARNQFGG